MVTNTKDVLTRSILAEKLGVTGHYWYPLAGGPKPINVECFEASVFLDKYSLDKLINVIKGLGNLTINSILETDEDSKISIDELDCYCGIEVIYCNDNVDWAIYFSHENTVTLIGQILIDTIKKDWSDWDKYKDYWRQN